MIQISWPNRITIARILLIGPFVLALLHLRDVTWARHAALAVFFATAISDGLDGFLARRLRQFSRLGKILDPIADKMLITASMILLAYEGTAIPGKEIPDAVVVAAVGKDVVVLLGFMVVFLVTGEPLIKPRLYGKSATAVQLVTVVAVLLWPDLPAWLGYLPDVLWWGAAVLAVIATLDYVRVGARFVTSFEKRAEAVPAGPREPARR